MDKPNASYSHQKYLVGPKISTNKQIIGPRVSKCKTTAMVYNFRDHAAARHVTLRATDEVADARKANLHQIANLRVEVGVHRQPVEDDVSDALDAVAPEVVEALGVEQEVPLAVVEHVAGPAHATVLSAAKERHAHNLETQTVELLRVSHCKRAGEIKGGHGKR